SALFAATLALVTASSLAAQQMGTAPREVVRAAVPPGLAIDGIKFRSDDRLAGRLTGSPGADTAAAYLARRFKAVGLQPAAGGWVQRFTIALDAAGARAA